MFLFNNSSCCCNRQTQCVKCGSTKNDWDDHNKNDNCDRCRKCCCHKQKPQCYYQCYCKCCRMNGGGKPKFEDDYDDNDF